MKTINYSFLSHTSLFQGTSENEIKEMLSCLCAKVQTFHKNETIYHVGTRISALGIVLDGSISLENDDIWGNKHIIDTIRPGQVFAETYATVPNEPLLVNVIALEPSTVLFLQVEKLLTTCTNACTHHQKLIHNLLFVSAQKNIKLSHKIFHMSPKTIREKLLSFLSYQSVCANSYEFEISYNRQQLADYLGVDRSALSTELSKMQKEGILTFHKNSFHILKEA